MSSDKEKKRIIIFFLILLILAAGIPGSHVFCQQIKLYSGTYLKNSGAYINVNGKIDNAGTINNTGTFGLSASGDWQNSGNFIAGAANHRIGGNFSNNGTFTGTGSTITCNGSAAQTIEGTSSTTFNNLVIDNAIGVTLTSNELTTVSGNLTLNNGAKFEINPGKQLTVAGTLTNNGILNLKSDATSIFSLMMSGYTGTGSANIQLYLTGGGGSDYRWHYVAVPANLSDKTVFTSINSKNLLRYDDNEIPDGNDHTNSEGWVWNDGYKPGDTEGGPYSGPDFSTLDVGRGYNFFHFSSSAVATFSNLSSLQASLGPLTLQYSGSNKTVPSNYGFNLLGNSLTCGIDWDKVIEVIGDPSNAVYFTVSGKVGMYLRGVPESGLNGATNHIPPLQGFFVKTNAPGASLSFSAAKEHTSQQRYKGEDVKTNPLIKLELNNSGNQDETLVWFNEKATNSFDGNFDASKLFSSEAGYDQIYTWFGSEKFGINGIPFPARTIIIPVAVKFLRSGSDYKIIASQLQGLDDYKVTLTDKGNANLTVNLKNTDRYTFSSEAGIFTDRFFLTITNVFTGIPDIIVPEIIFNLFVFDRILNIELLSDEWEGRSSTINIYDLTGRKVFQQINVEWYKGERKQIFLNNLPGIYIVEIKSEVQKFVSKIVII